MLTQQSDQIQEIATALAKAQGILKNPGFDSSNPYFKSKYLSLSGIIDAIRPITQFGLSYVQAMTVIDNHYYLMTTLYHSSGQWIRSINPIICKDATDPQKFGSSTTYAKRQALQALLGVVGDEDDDGNAAAAPAQTITMEQATEVVNLIGDEDELRKKIIDAIRKETANPKAAISEMPAHRLKMYLSSIQQWKSKKEGNYA